MFPQLLAPQVLQASDNVLENLDGVANLPRLQELLLCNNRILPSVYFADSSQGKEQAAGGQTTDTDRVISRQDRKQGLGRVS